MGFGNRYKILGDHSGAGSASASPSPSKQHKVVEFVKRWLLCGGWNLDSMSASEYFPVMVSPGKKKASDSAAAEKDGYVRPPRWKQFVRRVRAKSRKVQNACCEGLCFHPPQQPLNYCSTDSYERNFDKGREFWEENIGGNNVAGGSSFAVLRTTFAAPSSYATTLHPTNSSTPILWEDVNVDHSDSHMVGIPASMIWHKREPHMKLSHPITVSAR